MEGTSLSGVSDMKVMGLLEEAEDWGKLEVRMMVIWKSITPRPSPVRAEDVERVTLRLLSQRPSAPLSFQGLCEEGRRCGDLDREILRGVCDHVARIVE